MLEFSLTNFSCWQTQPLEELLKDSRPHSRLPAKLLHEMATSDQTQTQTKTAKAIDLEGRGYREWLATVSPHIFAGYNWPEFHAGFWDWCWPLLLKLRDGERLTTEKRALLYCLGRGLGKSTNAEHGLLAAGALKGELLAVYLSSKQDKANPHISSLRELIESTELARYYPAFAQPRVGKFGNQRGYKQSALYLANQFAVVALGLDVGARGLRDAQRRPSLFILDDIDEREDTPQAVEKKWKTIAHDILPMAAPGALVMFVQNPIHADSVMSKIAAREIDLLAHREQIGPLAAFSDDLLIEKRDGRNVIVCGTPTWERLDMVAAQQFLDNTGYNAFMAEYQNVTETPAEELVWAGYNETYHVITWSQFAAVFGQAKIPAGWYLYGGYDRGYTGPARHPSAVSVAAVAAENTALAGDVFVFYEWTGEAGATVDDIARDVIRGLAERCAESRIQQAAVMLRSSDAGIAEDAAWALRKMTGGMLGFKVLNGSHEGLSERETFRRKWGFPMDAGASGKTEGLSQLHHYLGIEHSQRHPFKEGLQGKPNLFLVVADEQAEAAADASGLKRHRWEARHLRYDPNIQGRDVPTKRGDDMTDACKQYFQTFAFKAKPLTYRERVEREIRPALRLERLRAESGKPGLTPEQELAYFLERQEAEKRVKQRSGYQKFDDQLKRDA